MYYNLARVVQLFKQTQTKNNVKNINMINISSFNSERELRGTLNELDKHKQLLTQCCVNGGPASQTVDQHYFLTNLQADFLFWTK